MPREGLSILSRIPLRLYLLDPFSDSARDLLSQSSDTMAALYPAESNHIEAPENLVGPHVRFVGAYDGDVLCGCGAAKIVRSDPPYGEIKRVFVPSSHRGLGVSKAIMSDLETWLLSCGIGLSRLETGIHQPEAIGLYRSLGYREIGPFGTYTADPLSLFMEKPLG